MRETFTFFLSHSFPLPLTLTSPTSLPLTSFVKTMTPGVGWSRVGDVAVPHALATAFTSPHVTTRHASKSHQVYSKSNKIQE